MQAVGSEVAESFTVEQKPEVLACLDRRTSSPLSAGPDRPGAGTIAGSGDLRADELRFPAALSGAARGLARYREAFATSGAKSDPTDPPLLLELVRTHRDRLRAWQPDDALTRQLRLLVEHRRRTVADRTRLTNRLTALLKTYFPQALEWAGDLRGAAACEFLQNWPTLEAVQQARRSQLRRFYHDHRRLSA